MRFKLTLLQDLPHPTPSALWVKYAYGDGRTTTWPVRAIGPDCDVAVVTVECAGDLARQADVRSRELIAHYPVEPTTVPIAISSVHPIVGAPINYQTEEPMSTPYQISIEMSQATVDALKGDGYYLFGFKAVKASGAKGAPLVWFRTLDYALSTKIDWEEQYQAYTTRGEIVSGARIVASSAYSIGLDQTLNVTGEAGTGSVDTQHGTPLAISINNATSNQFVAGISQAQPNASGGGYTPMCAFNLFGNHLDLIVPIEQVLLMFSTEPVDTGTVIEQAYSSGLLIDLTANNSRTVQYDINAGWIWNGESWGAPVKAQASLVPLLIQSSSAQEQLGAAAGGAQLATA